MIHFKLEFVARHKEAYGLAETDIWKFKKSVKSAKKSEKAGAVMGPGLRWRLHVAAALRSTDTKKCAYSPCSKGGWCKTV